MFTGTGIIAQCTTGKKNQNLDFVLPFGSQG